jgi:hypothetical protein
VLSSYVSQEDFVTINFWDVAQRTVYWCLSLSHSLFCVYVVDVNGVHHKLLALRLHVTGDGTAWHGTAQHNAEQV